MKYINETAAKFHLNQYVQLHSRVISTIWSESDGCWDIEYEQFNPLTGETTTLLKRADILINVSGILNRKKMPDIPGLENFQGTLVHSAAWDENLECTSKRIGIIGNGSSAI